MNTEIIHCCELYGGPFDGYKYTDIDLRNRFMLTPKGYYAIYELTAGKWDHNKNMYYDRLDFKGYSKAI